MPKIADLTDILASTTISTSDDFIVVDVSGDTTYRITFGELLDAIMDNRVSAEITDAIAAEAARANSYVDAPFTTTIVNGTPYDILDTDTGNVMIEGRTATNHTFNIDDTAMAVPAGSAFDVTVIGTGTVTVAGVNGTTIAGTNSVLTQGQSRTYYKRSANNWWGMSG